MKQKQNPFLADFWAQPVSNAFKVGGLALGVAYLWLFMQLAPIIKEQAVMANDIANIKDSVAEIKADIKDLNRELLSEDTRQSTGSGQVATRQVPVYVTVPAPQVIVQSTPAPTPAPQPTPTPRPGRDLVDRIVPDVVNDIIK